MEHASETRSLKIALAGYSLLVIAQLIAYFVTDILVLLAEALHSLSDVLISAFLLLTAFWSRKPADEFHMFGHGRAQNVAALVAGTIFISFMSVEMFREAIGRFSQVPKTSEPRSIILALAVTVVGMIVVAIPLVDILRAKVKSASVKAQLIALFKDEFSYIAALAGVIFIARGYIWADALASIIVATVIALGGLYLLKDNFHYLVGRAPGKQFMEKVTATAKSVRGVSGVHDLKAEFVGPNLVHTGFHIEIARGTPVEEADRIAHEVQQKVSQQTGCHYCFVHVDPTSEPPTEPTAKQ